jgi:hypothetical protein
MDVVVRQACSGPVRHVEYDLSNFMRQPLNAMLGHLAEVGKFYNERRSNKAGSDDGILHAQALIAFHLRRPVSILIAFRSSHSSRLPPTAPKETEAATALRHSIGQIA